MNDNSPPADHPAVQSAIYHLTLALIRSGSLNPAELTAAARRSGIEGKAGPAAYATLGMDPSLNRLSPFIATLLAQLRSQYGLDLDASLRGMQVRLLEQTGDSARLRLRYQLAGSEIDAVVPVQRIDGHWYLVDFLRRAEASLAGRQAAAGAKNPASP